MKLLYVTIMLSVMFMLSQAAVIAKRQDEEVRNPADTQKKGKKQLDLTKVASIPK